MAIDVNRMIFDRDNYMAELSKQGEDNLQAERDSRGDALLQKFRTGRNQDLAEGRARGEELFGKDPALNDILARRKSALEGFNSPEQNALRSQALSQITRQGQTQARGLRGVQAASGVRGAAAAAQQVGLMKNLQKSQAETEQNIYLQNLANKGQALGDYEKTVGGIKSAQLGTELGYGQLGSQERSAASQQAIGEQQAAAARAQAAKNQGKK